MDNRIRTFLAAHPGQFYCTGCLRVEAVPSLNATQVNHLTRPLRHVKPYRKGTVVCISCDEVRECIAYGLRRDQLSWTQARQLGATARKRGRPIYENPCVGDRAEAWRQGWVGASAAAADARSPLKPGSFAGKLYDYLVRHDQDVGLTAREITDGLVERDSAAVNSGLYNLYRRGFVRRLLPKFQGRRRTPQRYRAVPRPPGVGG